MATGSTVETLANRILHQNRLQLIFVSDPVITQNHWHNLLSFCMALLELMYQHFVLLRAGSVLPFQKALNNLAHSALIS